MSINIPTWKTMAAPDYSSANWLGAQASKSMRQGFQDLSGAFRDQAEIGRDTLTGEAMAQLSQLDDINTFDQDKANLLGGIDMGNIHQDKFMNALMSRRDTLDSRDASAYERKYRDQIMGLKLAGLQRSASGGGGRGGGRGGSSGGGASSFEGANGASQEDMLWKALQPEMKDMNPVEADRYFMGKINQFDMSTKQGRYTIKNNQGNAQTRHNKKKSDAYSAKSAVTDKIVNSGESSWYSMLPGAGMNFDEGANLETERLVLDARAAGVKENDIIKNITDNRGKNRVSDRYETKKGFERLTRAAKAARGEE